MDAGHAGMETAAKVGYDKVEVAPPPYMTTVHEHADYSAGAGSSQAGVVYSVGPANSFAPQPSSTYTSVASAGASFAPAPAGSGQPPPPLPNAVAVTIPHQAGQDADKDKPVGNIVHHFGNMLFPVLGLGLVSALLYTLLCLCLCILIVGLPYARTLLRQASLSMQPYGTELRFKKLRRRKTPQSTFLNLMWFLSFGFAMFIFHVTIAIVMFATIVLIPFGVIHWRLGKRILWPVGVEEAGPGTDNAALSDDTTAPAAPSGAEAAVSVNEKV